MIREAFKVVTDADNNPVIRKVDVTDPEGVSWREAKKQLRSWYLEQAASLRQVSQQTYFGEQA